MTDIMCLRVAGAVALLVGTTVASHETPIRVTPAEIAGLLRQWAGAGTSGVTGIETTILAGNPESAGPYTIQLRVPPNTRIAAHTHRDDRSTVVVSGAWYFGYGPRLDEHQVKALGPGSYYTEPAGEAHFAVTRTDPVTVIITGVGPTDTRPAIPVPAPR